MCGIATTIVYATKEIFKSGKGDQRGERRNRCNHYSLGLQSVQAAKFVSAEEDITSGAQGQAKDSG